MPEASREYLIESCAMCADAVNWLRRSLNQSPEPPYDEDLSPEDWDQLEALAGRYARLTDLVIHKLFRALDRYEFEATGSLLDSANRAAKRGIVESPDALRHLKDIRNEIVHEYAVDDLLGLYADIHQASCQLLKLVEKVQAYLLETHQL